MAASEGECSAPRELTLHPVFQPIVTLQEGQVVGFEALSRPYDPEGRALSPDAVFRAAEAQGYAPSLDRLALARIAERARVHLPRGVRLFVNVSPATLLTCPEALAPLEPLAPRVVLEVTERQMIDTRQEPAFGRRLLQLRRKGYGLALDDLGEGEAGLRRVLFMRPEYVKLGLALVQGLEADPARVALVSSLVHYARLAGTSLIAEGVETEACRALLTRLGVPLAQGFYFARPEPDFRGLPDPTAPLLPLPAGHWQGEALRALLPLLALGEGPRPPAPGQVARRLAILLATLPAEAYAVRRLRRGHLELIAGEGPRPLLAQVCLRTAHLAAEALLRHTPMADQAASEERLPYYPAGAAVPIWAGGAPWGTLEVAFTRAGRLPPELVGWLELTARVAELLLRAQAPRSHRPRGQRVPQA